MSHPLIGVVVSRHRNGRDARRMYHARFEGPASYDKALRMAGAYQAIGGNKSVSIVAFGDGPDTLLWSNRRRRVLHEVFHGSTHSTSHFIRSRLIRGEPDPGRFYGPNRERLTTSLNAIINSRVGLFADRAATDRRDTDVKPPYKGRRFTDTDPRRLP